MIEIEITHLKERQFKQFTNIQEATTWIAKQTGDAEWIVEFNLNTYGSYKTYFIV